ncbi:MAG: TasA family protein [bacterium]|nr:TasA family protein [bacterium]
MQKIILSLLVLGLAGTVAIGATRAYFSDVETSTGNTFAAGTFDLNLDGGNINVVKFSLSNLVPGNSGTAYWTVKNVGNVNGYLDLESKTVVNDDNSCNEPEGLVDTTCGAGEGDLGANTNITLFVDVNHDGVVDGGDVSLYTGTLNGLVAATVADISLNANTEKYISMNWAIPVAVENIIQSDSTTLGMTFELGQTTGQ